MLVIPDVRQKRVGVEPIAAAAGELALGELRLAQGALAQNDLGSPWFGHA